MPPIVSYRLKKLIAERDDAVAKYQRFAQLLVDMVAEPGQQFSAADAVMAVRAIILEWRTGAADLVAARAVLAEQEAELVDLRAWADVTGRHRPPPAAPEAS